MTKAEKYDRIVEKWREEGATTIDVLRLLAELIDGVEAPKKSRSV
ncbi:hypothetical protein [Shouchella clausii]|nr:hypothetical protein [Shouchella clausii]MCY1105850.1 hypothetical protein [Shouchella clausii]